MAGPLLIICEAGTHRRVHYAFVLAAGAAAMGRSVSVFATNGGLHGLCRDWSGLEDAGRDECATARGVAGLAELRDAAVSLGVRLIACEAGLRMEGLAPGALLDCVEIGGVASLLADPSGVLVVL